MDLAAASTEYVHVAVTANSTIDGSPVDLTDPPRFAFLPGIANPADGDWQTGEWADGTARILIGPHGDTALDPDTYWCWLTWSAGDETPVYRPGRIRIF